MDYGYVLVRWIAMPTVRHGTRDTGGGKRLLDVGILVYER